MSVICGEQQYQQQQVIKEPLNIMSYQLCLWPEMGGLRDFKKMGEGGWGYWT